MLVLDDEVVPSPWISESFDCGHKFGSPGVGLLEKCFADVLPGR